MLTIIKNKDAIYDTDNYDVVLVATSVYCKMANGFQSKIKCKYPYVDEANMKTKYASTSKLGTRLTIEGKPTISLLYVVKKRMNLEHLRKCLQTANAEFRGKRVMCPILGSTRWDGNADKEVCLKLMEECLTDVDLYVYDYEQMDKLEEAKLYRDKIMLLMREDKTKYRELWENRYKILKEKFYLIGVERKKKYIVDENGHKSRYNYARTLYDNVRELYEENEKKYKIKH